MDEGSTAARQRGAAQGCSTAVHESIISVQDNITAVQESITEVQDSITAVQSSSPAVQESGSSAHCTIAVQQRSAGAVEWYIPPLLNMQVVHGRCSLFMRS